MDDKAAVERECFAFVWGDGEPDREPGEHVWQPQPFYNQDTRSWCSRCGCLQQR